MGNIPPREYQNAAPRSPRTSLLAIRGALVALRGLEAVANGLRWFGNRVASSTSAFVWSFLFHTVFRHLYRVYRPMKVRIQNLFRPAKGRLTYLLSTRYIVHATMALIVLFVSANNLQAAEVRNENLGKESILFSLVGQTETELIVETAAVAQARPTGGYLTNSASVAATVPSRTGASTVDRNASATAQGSALLKPSLASTTNSPRTRDRVEYYIVQPGDTIGTIAETFAISANTILWENRLGDRDYIRPGDKLTILPLNGVSHQVKDGESLDAIAKKYNAEADKILEYNKLASADNIREADILIVPDGRVPPPPAPIRTAGTAQFASTGPVPASAPLDSSHQLQWPTPGRRINQYFTWRHSGIDIDTDRSPIYAAESGVVARTNVAGWGGGYGLHVVISHGDGLQTLYGHMNQIFVKPGQSVERGQTIGISGCTGRCTGDHLHFEVILGGKRNPLSYL